MWFQNRKREEAWLDTKQVYLTSRVVKLNINKNKNPLFKIDINKKRNKRKKALMGHETWNIFEKSFKF